MKVYRIGSTLQSESGQWFVPFFQDFQTQDIISNIAIPHRNSTTMVLTVGGVNGWIVIQQRVGQFVPPGTFNRSWTDYTNGFGNISGNYWMGLERMSQLTNSGSYILRIEIQTLTRQNWYSAEYWTFSVDPRYFYTLHVSGYSGDAGDSLQYPGQWNINNSTFTTSDANHNKPTNSLSCASTTGSGWWYSNCAYSALNAEKAVGLGDSNFFRWKTLSDLGLEPDMYLRNSRMMIKRRWLQCLKSSNFRMCSWISCPHHSHV